MILRIFKWLFILFCIFLPAFFFGMYLGYRTVGSFRETELICTAEAIDQTLADYRTAHSPLDGTPPTHSVYPHTLKDLESGITVSFCYPFREYVPFRKAMTAQELGHTDIIQYQPIYAQDGVTVTAYQLQVILPGGQVYNSPKSYMEAKQ